MSWAGPLVRFSTAPPLVIGAWRLALSVGFIALTLAGRRELLRTARLTAREWVLGVGSGLLLALHFWSWIASLGLTSVASSVVLVSTQPLFVAALSLTFLGERPSRLQWSGIALAVIGAAVIGWGDFARGRAPLLGDVLALAGAVFAAGYYVIGRRLRQRLDIRVYTGLVYGIAAVALALATLASPAVDLIGYPRQDWLIFLALAAGPMMIGHTGVNYALRYVPAYVANLVVLGEPVGATIIAWLLPAIGERPSQQTLAGGMLILFGIALGVARQKSRPTPGTGTSRPSPGTGTTS